MSFITPYESCLLQLPEVFTAVYRDCVGAVEKARSALRTSDYATVTQALNQVRHVSLDFLESSMPLKSGVCEISQAKLSDELQKLSSLLIAKLIELHESGQDFEADWVEKNADSIMTTIRNTLTMLCSHTNLRPPRLELLAQ